MCYCTSRVGVQSEGHHAWIAAFGSGSGDGSGSGGKHGNGNKNASGVGGKTGPTPFHGGHFPFPFFLPVYGFHDIYFVSYVTPATDVGGDAPFFLGRAVHAGKDCSFQPLRVSAWNAWCERMRPGGELYAQVNVYETLQLAFDCLWRPVEEMAGDDFLADEDVETDLQLIKQPRSVLLVAEDGGAFDSAVGGVPAFASPDNKDARHGPTRSSERARALTNDDKTDGAQSSEDDDYDDGEDDTGMSEGDDEDDGEGEGDGDGDDDHDLEEDDNVEEDEDEDNAEEDDEKDKEDGEEDNELDGDDDDDKLNGIAVDYDEGGDENVSITSKGVFKGKGRGTSTGAGSASVAVAVAASASASECRTRGARATAHAKKQAVNSVSKASKAAARFSKVNP